MKKKKIPKNTCLGCLHPAVRSGENGTPLCVICKEVTEDRGDMEMIYVQVPAGDKKFIRAIPK